MIQLNPKINSVSRNLTKLSCYLLNLHVSRMDMELNHLLSMESEAIHLFVVCCTANVCDVLCVGCGAFRYGNVAPIRCRPHGGSFTTKLFYSTLNRSYLFRCVKSMCIYTFSRHAFVSFSATIQWMVSFFFLQHFLLFSIHSDFRFGRWQHNGGGHECKTVSDQL